MAIRRCKRCLGPLQRSSQHGICHRNPDCRRAANAHIQRARRQRLSELRPKCQLCRLPMLRRNPYGVCTRITCMAEYQARWRRAHPEFMARQRAAWRAYYWAHAETCRANRRIYYRKMKAALNRAGLTTQKRYRQRASA